MPDEDLPGFDHTQSFTIETVVERAVCKGVQSGIAAYRDDHCREHIERTDALEAAMFGRAEKGIVGFKERLTAQERAMRTLVFCVIMLAGWAGITAFTLVKDIVEHHVLGF